MTSDNNCWLQEQVLENPRASMAVTVEDLEPCIGCMAVTANVLLQRRCGSAENRYDLYTMDAEQRLTATARYVTYPVPYKYDIIFFSSQYIRPMLYLSFCARSYSYPFYFIYLNWSSVADPGCCIPDPDPTITPSRIRIPDQGGKKAPDPVH
jgi:hypothetical protein